MASYTPSITVDEAKAIIKALPKDKAIDYAQRFANVTEADVDDEGDVWVANPCAGHWLDGDKLCLLAEGIEAGI